MDSQGGLPSQEDVWLQVIAQQNDTPFWVEAERRLLATPRKLEQPPEEQTGSELYSRQ